MLRNTFLAVIAVLAVSASSQAAITLSIDAGVDAPGLAGFKRHIVTATSTIVGEAVTGVDMIGDPAAPVNPATSKGFFGTMNQVAAGPFATPLQDFNSFMPQPNGPQQDSQFLFATNAPSGAVQSPTGFSKEDGQSLQALFSRDTGFGETFQLAQLVLPAAATAIIDWRGTFSVLRGGVNVDVDANGQLITGPPGGIIPIIALTALGERELSAGLITSALATSAGDPPITWSNLTQTGGPVAANAATLSGTNNSTFNWNPAGSKAGKKGSGNVLYSWTATATNIHGADTDVAITVILIPEPATMALFGFAAIGVVVFIRRRAL